MPKKGGEQGTWQMAQWVMSPASKTEDLGLSPSFHMMEGDSQKLSSDRHGHTSMGTRTAHSHTTK